MSIAITAAALRTIASGASPEIVAGIVDHQALLARYGIDTPRRVQHFLGQCACETTGFTRLEENLHYTTTARLRAVWPSRFKTDAAAAPYLRNPPKLANFVYGGRLGNTGPNDGWLYRGSGCKQTTGKTNFAAVEGETRIPVTKHPEMLRRFPEALESACIYWRDNRLNRFADAGDVVGLTKAIQGGSGGLADRRIYTDRAGRIDWTAGAAPAAPQPQIADPILRKGSHGEAVRRAQQLLAAHGYEIRVDSDFGSGTDNVVRQFQEDRGLLADGVIGPATWTALKTAPRSEEKPAEADTASAPPVSIWAMLAALFARLFVRN